MVPEFEACAFAAEVGVPASCTTQFGHHLVLVEEERASAPQVETMGPLDLAEFLETMGQVRLHPGDASIVRARTMRGRIASSCNTVHGSFCHEPFETL